MQITTGASLLRELNAILTSPSLQRALSESAWAGREILHCDASIIFLRQSGSNLLTATAWNGRDAQEVTLSTTSSYLQALWASRRSIIWSDPAACVDPEMTEIMDSMGLSSGMLLPLRVNNEYTGAWLVAAVQPHIFDETEEHILQTLADNIGLTIESMLLSNENLRYRREADALYEIGKEISQLLDLDRVLEMVVKKTRSLLNAELSYLALADDKDRVVRVRVTDGTRDKALGQMVLRYGEGVGGTVAANRMPLLVDHYPADPRPKPPGIADIAATEDILSIVCVPMLSHTGLVGVLFAASRQEAAFNPSQMELLAALGTQAAIAIENAHLFENEKETAKKLLEATVTSDKLLQLVLGNQGLPAITNTLSGLVHAPVIVEDRYHHTIAASTVGAIGPDGKPLQNVLFSTDDVWYDASLAEGLYILQNTHHAIHIPPRPDRKIYHARTITPIVAGSNLLGYISVLEVEALTEQQYSAIDQASIVLALEFLKIEAGEEVEARLAGDLLDDLVFGRTANDPSVLQRADRFRIDLRQPHRILVLDIDQFALAVRQNRWNDITALAIKRRFLGTVNAIIHRNYSGALTGTRSDSVLVLMPTRTNETTEVITAQARTLQHALREALPELTISVGIGRAAITPSEFPSSFEQAMLALRTVSLLGGQGRVVAYESLGVIPLLLQSQDQTELVVFMENQLGPLLQYDKDNQTQLVYTLERFLAHNGNLRQTAEDCHVHLNSLKYRLQRIEEISHLDMHDGETRFRAQLAFAIHNALKLVQD